MKKIISLLLITVIIFMFASCNMKGYYGVHIVNIDGTSLCKKGISSYYAHDGGSIDLTFYDGTTIRTDTSVATIYTSEMCPICEANK